MLHRNSTILDIPDGKNAIRSLDSYRNKLVEKIVAQVQNCDNIKRLITVSLLTLDKKKVHAHLKVRFLEKLIIDLETIKGLNTDPVLQAGICIALENCTLMKVRITQPVGL